MAIKLSIGMPLYNAAPWLPQAIESILAQTYADFEFIISDNASSDASETICRDYAARDKRIQYHRNPKNIGLCENYNAVFRYATGVYFKWASSNDICAPTFLARCVEVLDRNPDVVLCYPRTLLFNDILGTEEHYQDGLHLMSDDPFTRLAWLLASIGLNNAINGLIRADALHQTNLISVYFSSDIKLLAELALRGKFYEVPDFLYRRRMEPRTASRLQSRDRVVEYFYPNRDNRMLFQHWKLAAGYFAAVSGSPLSVSQRLKCYRLVLKRLRWERKNLINDIVEAFPVPTRDTRMGRGK